MQISILDHLDHPKGRALLLLEEKNVKPGRIILQTNQKIYLSSSTFDFKKTNSEKSET